MSKVSKTTLKSYFKTGNIPTQTMFENLIDTLLDCSLGLGIVDNNPGESSSERTAELDIAGLSIYVSGLTSKTYENPTAAANALLALSKQYSTVPDGISISYKDSMSRYWSYRYEGGSWVLNGDRISIPINLHLNDEYISTSGVGTLSSTIAGEGSEENPYVYSHGASQFIEYHEYESIYYHGWISNANAGIACYDKDYKFLSAPVKGSSGSVAEVTKYLRASEIPAGTKYIRYCTQVYYMNGSSVAARDYGLNIESDSAAERNAVLVEDLTQRVRNLEAFTPSGIAGFWADSLDPEEESEIGDPSILDDWDFHLIDVANKRDLGKLQKNNIFRFEDGSYAPVVVCSGSAAVEKEYETEDKGYMIIRSWNGKKFLINGVGNSGREVIGLFNQEETVDGVTSVELDQTGIAAGLATTKDSKARVIPFKNVDCATGSKGKNNIVTYFTGDSYIRTAVCGYGGSATNEACRLSRALNGNTSNPFDKSVFSEQMAIHKLSHIYAHFLKYKTYYLHNPQRWGGGTSSNEGAPNASNWGTKSGIRWSIDNRQSYSYGAWSTTASNFYATSSKGSPGNWSEFVNNYYSKWKCLEHLVALSYAVENGIEPDTEFSVYGERYLYKTIEGTKSPLEGELNAKLFKLITLQFNAFDASGNTITVDADLVLVAPVVDGYISWGDVFDYGYGGLEAVSKATNEAQTEREIRVYLCTHQSELTDDNTVSTETQFAFESTYRYLGKSSVVTYGDGYAAKLMPLTIIPSANGAGLTNGACAYSWRSHYAGDTYTKKARLGIRGRGLATDGHDSSRLWYGHVAASLATQAFAFAPQVGMENLSK